MKKFASFCFVCTLCVLLSQVAFATSDEKEYIVFPKSSDIAEITDESVSDGGFLVVDEEELDSLLVSGNVEWYEENYEVSFFDAGEDQYEWQFDMTNAEAASEIGCFGQTVRVALIDSGIDADHPAFENANIAEGWNYAEGNSDVSDQIDHGTSVAGIIVAKTNGVRIDSLAPCVELVPIKCVSGNSETILMDDLCNSIYGAINDFDCDVINLSLGLSSNSTALKNAIQYAEENGVTVVAAIGNNATGSANGLQYPAAYESVIGVGSVDSTGKVSYFSRVNDSVFILAPGEKVLTTFVPVQDENDNSVWYYYGWGYGTSISAPLVTATAAVMKNADSDLLPSEIMEIISETATESEFDTVSGYDTTYGYGILNCEAALEKVLEDVEIFVSPAVEKENLTSAYIYNNSEAAFSGYLFSGKFEKDILENVTAENVSLQAGQKEKVSASNSGNIEFFVFGKPSESASVKVKSVSFSKATDGENIKLRVKFSSDLNLDDISVMLSSKKMEATMNDTDAIIHIGKTEETSDGVYEAVISSARLKKALGETIDGSILHLSLTSRNMVNTRSEQIVFKMPENGESVAISATASFVATSNIGEKISVSGIEYTNTIGKAERGSVVTVTAPAVDGYVFRFWKRGSADNGVYISSAAKYTFKLMTHTYLTAIYDKVEPDSSTVEFFNGNGELVEYVSVADGTRFSDITAPKVSLTGYEFLRWSADEEMEINGTLRTVAIYEDSGNAISGSVTVNGKAVGEVKYGDEVKCTSQSPDFTCWRRDGNVVSYNRQYSYYVWDGTDIRESDEDCEILPVVYLDDPANGAFMIEYDAGGKLICETGILFGDSTDISVNSCSSKVTSQRNTDHGQLTAKPGGEELFARGYMIYMDGDKFGVIYSSAISTDQEAD
ncbi:MAG: S8 family serine peptidase [Oscillospiraceae bacterium]|nr:S8 family serine peptidase [Oscillospiraceae bacterium]